MIVAYEYSDYRYILLCILLPYFILHGHECARSLISVHGDIFMLYWASRSSFDIYWMTFGLYIWNWLQMTYLQSWKQQEVSDFSVHDWMGLSHVEHVKWLWSPLLGSLDDTWSQYLLLTLNDLHIALKVARGLKFQWTWLNGTVTCKACEVALSTF